MNMILIHRNFADNSGESLLRFALTSEPVAGVVLNGLYGYRDIRRDSILRLSAKWSLDKTFYAIPEEWDIEPLGFRHQNQIPQQSLYDAKPDVIRYKESAACRGARGALLAMQPSLPGEAALTEARERSTACAQSLHAIVEAL